MTLISKLGTCECLVAIIDLEKAVPNPLSAILKKLQHYCNCPMQLQIHISFYHKSDSETKFITSLNTLYFYLYHLLFLKLDSASPESDDLI